MYLEELDMSSVINNAGELVGDVFGKHQEQKWSAPECGKRPFFVGRRRNEWEQCRAQSASPQISPGGGGAQPKTNFFEQNKTPLLIGGAVLGGIVIFSLLNRK